MKTLTSLLGAALLKTAFGATAYAANPDVYVVNFRNDTDVKSQALDSALPSAVAIAGVNAEQVNIDTSTAAKWEKGAHEAFDRDIVPIFNKWVGLPGFAAVVDAKTKRVIGCVSSQLDTTEIARELKKMAARATGNAYISNASTNAQTTQCPAAHNVDPANL
ncbi:hypothetical protein DES40_0805 [Litorimonas taeanensis]|uniref:Uncharacterized protein n=1 Tax=Litorimonas taeanensis TaxID=568099 RepID=A0A420WKC9_9PROT|nr:hypothetical protein [Litorimonas taeanensis]RKQ71483.1 hypothetical protein DES40_0805 [Litorimonas taeanensis]